MKNELLNILLLFHAFILLTNVFLEKIYKVLIIHSSIYEVSESPNGLGLFIIL